MRKQVLAFLSMIGLAGSATPASPQVLKGSANTSKESTVKNSKANQENKAAGKVVAHGAGDKTSANAAIQDKRKDAAAEGNAAKDAAAHKMRKAGGEQTAAQDAVNEKVGADRGRKAGGEQEDKLGNKKAVKGAAEVNAGQSAIQHKEQKAGAEKAAVSGGGAGKVAVHDIVPAKSIKGEKAAAETNGASGDHIKKVKNNAAETQAAQQNANKKAAKQVDQASPK